MAVDLSMKVLIVDDYSAMRRIVRTLMEQLHFVNIEEASDGTQALEKLRQDTYCLVISDWNMSPMTGIDLLRAVRADEALKALPFIMITAEIKTENVIAAKQAGVSTYIVKPFTARTLKAKLETVLGDF